MPMLTHKMKMEKIMNNEDFRFDAISFYRDKLGNSIEIRQKFDNGHPTLIKGSVEVFEDLSSFIEKISQELDNF